MELNFLEIFGTIVGLVYLWLEYRASIYLWIAGIVMPAIYIFVYYKAGLYADFGINIYYLIAAIYGWFFWMWGHRKKKGQLTTADASTGDTPKDLPIVHTPGKCYLPLFLVFVVSFLGIAWILIAYTDSNVPWLDSFSIEHCRYVDAGTQIRRAMVCLDFCGYCLLRTLYLQRPLFYFRFIRTLLHYSYLWLL